MSQCKQVAILAHLGDFSGPYAQSRQVEMFARGLSEEGHNVSIIIPLTHKAEPLVHEEKGFQIYSFVDGHISNSYQNRVLARLRAWRWLQKKMAAKELDWLLLYSVGIEGLAYSLTAKMFGVKVASIYADLRFHPEKKTISDHIRLTLLEMADSLIPRLSNHVLVYSTFLKERIKRFAPTTPCDVIPPLLNMSLTYNRQSATDMREKYHLQDNIVLGYFGAFWVINGVINLLKATKILVEQGLPVKTLIAGRMASGVDCDNVPVLIDEMQLQDHVIYLGLLSQEEALNAMGACDILTLPRIDHDANRAGTSTKLTEYLCLGKPVIAANIGDISLYVKDEESVLLIKPGSVEALVSAIQRLIDDPALRQKLAANAPQAAHQAFYYRNALKPLLQAVNGTAALTTGQ